MIIASVSIVSSLFDTLVTVTSLFLSFSLSLNLSALILEIKDILCVFFGEKWELNEVKFRGNPS